VLCEGAASLLPDADRPAVLWSIDLDGSGEPVAVDLRRTTVRSRARLDYPGVQSDADAGRLHPSLALLPEIGRLRLQAARRRHAINLDLPDSEVVPDGDGKWTLERRAILPVESYNAEISLLTGMCAATIMLAGRVGILRTLPPPTQQQVMQLRRATAVLGIPWPDDEPPGDVVSTLDSSKPREAAFLEDAVRLLRGAGYTPFDKALPEQPGHGGVGAPYAHVTAPLRRLVDRFATEVCLALHAGTPVPDWARSALPALPGIMAAADRVSDQLERACSDAVSEFLLAGRVGERFTGIVVQMDAAKDRATVLLDDPPVRARCSPDHLTEGSRVTVRLVGVDADTHVIQVQPAG
jgi:exoribonuclease R